MRFGAGGVQLIGKSGPRGEERLRLSICIYHASYVIIVFYFWIDLGHKKHFTRRDAFSSQLTAFIITSRLSRCASPDAEPKAEH
jgi:hypothetical protein